MPNTESVSWVQQSSPMVWQMLQEEPELESFTPKDDSLEARAMARARQQLADEIERAEQSLVDWSAEGSEEYTRETLHRATRFLEVLSNSLWRKCARVCPVPAIGPGPDGSVDLYWKRPTKQLLVNIPSDDGDRATFFGSDYGAQRAKGSFSTHEPFSDGLAAWLM